ncbi:RsmB/NOP family class I SAM-dependent RNA methyltransferase [Phyllobacterium sp. 21LDTY02-6]|uniref:RsmB/NOP family class I SAM-dependent RNA methyltransferase n=1 Tax=Phyllobacterium sp. 21LDTY02-6 TaxID=2944903 RepID=UPI00202165EE|nr:RsmB/NOP family class I SAM-dependent RNA methyltransferase [Phyllobacterium sp. 21LDTY02-6]MCO4318622.1 RsmB/NOP family class I SAM-dependent RNA methyltransferase [Phyllobacterium sp. 21LDTY02-6]
MRLGGRLQAAIEVLEDIETRKRPASDALKDWGLSHRFAGAGDRAVIGNIVYDALRRRQSLAWRMDSDSARHIAYGVLLSDAELSNEAIEDTLAGDKFAPAPIEAVQLENWQTRQLSQAPDFVRADVPEWCVPHFEAVFGDDWIAEAAALGDRPPVDLRVNTLKANRDKVLKELARAGAVAAPLLGSAMRIAPLRAMGRHPNVQAEPAFQRGLFEVQDLGSQLAAKLANVQPGQQVLDYCAGAGGKTLAMAADMGNKGQIHAFDAERARLAPIFDRLKRAGVRNTQPHASIGDLAQFERQMDLVLVDAPCTGSGTWRRRPDAKWRLSEQQLERRMVEQRDVLEAAKAYVKPSGRLVYITCSLFAAENARQVSVFLENNADFTPVDTQPRWDEVVEADPSLRPLFRDGAAILSPLATSTDGFFISVLRRGK